MKRHPTQPRSMNPDTSPQREQVNPFRQIHRLARHTCILGAMLTFIFMGSIANATLVLDLRLDDTTRRRSVTSGTAVFVDMFLVDTDGSSAMSGPGGGLTGGGGKILATGIAGVTAATLISPGAGFTGPSASPVAGLDVPGIVSASVSAPFSFPIPGSVPSGSPGVGVTTLAEMTATEVWLARFSVTLTGAAGDSLLLTADRLGTAGGIFNNGNTALGFPPTDLDGLAVFGNSAASETISLSVTSVPEPSSVLVVAMFAGLGCVREHRRRRTKANRK